MCVWVLCSSNSRISADAGRSVVWNQQQSVCKNTAGICLKERGHTNWKQGGWVFDIYPPIISLARDSSRRTTSASSPRRWRCRVAMAIWQRIGGGGGGVGEWRLRLPGGVCHLRPCAGLHLASWCARRSVCSERVQEWILNKGRKPI